MFEKTIVKRWTPQEEIILKNWADKSKCFRWMHDRSHEIFKRKNYQFTIPVIFLSTIAGTANFAQDRFPEAWRSYAVMGIGGLNLLSGAITTVAQFLKVSEQMEGHRIASISWGKFASNVELELAKYPPDRRPVVEMMKWAKEEFDRLLETCPDIPDKVIKAFRKEVKGDKDLVLPDIVGTIRATTIYESKPEDYGPISGGKDIELIRAEKDFFAIHGRKPNEAELRELKSSTSPKPQMKAIMGPIHFDGEVGGTRSGSPASLEMIDIDTDSTRTTENNEPVGDENV